MALFLACFTENWVNFGPLTDKLEVRMLIYPKSTYSENLFRPLLRTVLSKFLHMIENGQNMLAHTHRGRGSLNSYLAITYKLV